MNTPTHILLSVALLTRDPDQAADEADEAGPGVAESDVTVSGQGPRNPSSDTDAREKTQRRASTYVLPAVIGAVLPDAPMFFFYAFEKFALGSSERAIWTTRYFLPAWQDFFDLFNSIPVALVGLWICRRSGGRSAEWLAVMFASMLLHFAADLPLHHDDGHRHFWPLSDWRFESPVSYWDPNHFGVYAGAAELALLVGCYVVAMKRHRRWGIRVGLTLLTAAHLGLMSLAIIYFATNV